MAIWALITVHCFVTVVFAGKETDEDLAHYIKKEPSTDMPWTSNERRINKMIEEEIIKFNYAPETTECPFDSQGKPRPTEGKSPIWWNAYRQAKDGDRPDWSAEIRELIKNPRTYPPWTPSQESEAALSKFKDISPFTWRPGAPIVNLRFKTDATTRPSSQQEPTTERSITASFAHWDPSEEEGDGGGGEGKEPPLNLAPLKKGYKEEYRFLKIKSKRKPEKHLAKEKQFSHLRQKKTSANKVHSVSELDKQIATDLRKNQKGKTQREIRKNQARQPKYNTINHNFARV